LLQDRVRWTAIDRRVLGFLTLCPGAQIFSLLAEDAALGLTIPQSVLLWADQVID
jgi:hypothetical protein